MDGFIRSENTLNPGATNVNRVIPYYDIESVKIAWKTYVQERTNERRIAEAYTSPLYFHFETIPGAGFANRGQIFRHIESQSLASKDRLEQYPGLKLLSTLKGLQLGAFLDEFYTQAYKSKHAPETAHAFFTDIQ